jgi:formylglycine-generating enzyme required for sulfatase activity
MRLIVLLIGLCFVTCTTFAQQKEQRVALVIGNSTYKSSPLKNPVNDARDMAASLRSYGFTVIERNNLTVKQIGSTLREFRSKLTPGSVALVFYAGHGLQIKGENYLPAVDADIVGEEDVPNQSLSTRQIMDVLGDAKSRLNLVFLDACRDNPYARSFRSSSRGLGKENAPSGTLISFATRPGSVAGDGDGKNGLYTSVLLQQIKNTDQPIEQVLKRVVTGVKTASKGQQEPWMEGSIEGDFCFGECGKQIVQSGVSDERVFWDAIKDSKDINEIRAYLDKFPTGVYAGIARVRVARLDKTGTSLNADKSLQPSVSIANSYSQGVKQGKVFKDCIECPDMVVVPGGNYLMGTASEPSPDPYSDVLPKSIGQKSEKPQHLVKLKSFAIGKYEVTQEEWYEVMGNNPSKIKGRNLPVEQVSWLEVQVFISKLNQKTGKKYRLPSESEWEYAARAGTTSDWISGNDESKLTSYAWFRENSESLQEVGKKMPNAFGLFDMYGNVWEWVEDNWHVNYSGAPIDGSPWLSTEYMFRGQRVVRGGSIWFGPSHLRSAYRVSFTESNRFDFTGFRLARDL